jgi:FkbM family methyltransferase
MTGATGNIYCGLHEPNDMGFLLHFLREKDLFMDVGANIGSYTVLASGVIGAETICFEPIPTTYQHLLDNIYLNRLVDRVQALNVAVGSEEGEIEMMADQDTVNRVVAAGEYSGLTIKVPVVTVDKILDGRVPKLIKIDVEGYETLVLESAKQTLENKALEAVIIELNGSGSVLGFDEDSIRRHFIDLGFTACTYDVRTRLLQEENDEIKNISDNTLYVRNIEATQDRLRHARYFNVLGANI